MPLRIPMLDSRFLAQRLAQDSENAQQDRLHDDAMAQQIQGQSAGLLRANMADEEMGQRRESAAQMLAKKLAAQQTAHEADLKYKGGQQEEERATREKIAGMRGDSDVTGKQISANASMYGADRRATSQSASDEARARSRATAGAKGGMSTAEKATLQAAKDEHVAGRRLLSQAVDNEGKYNPTAAARAAEDAKPHFEKARALYKSLGVPTDELEKDASTLHRMSGQQPQPAAPASTVGQQPMTAEELRAIGLTEEQIRGMGG